MSEEDVKEIKEDSKSPEKPKKKRLWLKVIFILFGLFCALVIGIYFYISSSSFIRNEVFAKIEGELNQPVTAEEINFSPFSGIELNNFSLGDDPFLKADKIKVSYELLPMLSNKINVNEITIENAELNVIFDRDGNLNIKSKMVKTIEDNSDVKKDKKSKDASKQAKSAKPVPEINIQNINFKNLKLHVFKDDSKEERQQTFNLENFNFSIPSIRNGEELKFELETAINCKAGEQFNLKKGHVKVSGTYKLSQDLIPEKVKLDIQISELDAINEGVQLPLQALNIKADMNIDGEKTSLNNVSINNPQGKASVTLSGILEKEAADLDVTIADLDSSILDLALVPLSGSKAFILWQEALSQVSEGKVAGFGNTLINFNGKIIAKSDKSLSTQGNLEIKDFPLVNISSQSRIEPVTTKVNYDLTASDSDKILELKKLTIDVSNSKSQILSLNLNSPLKLDTLNNKLTSEKDDQVTLTLNNFDLNLLKAFRKESKRKDYERGFISTECQLISKNSGEKLQLNINNLSINELALRTEEDKVISDINIQTSSQLSINDLAKITLENLQFSVKKGSDNLSSLAASGLINLETVEANIALSHLKLYPHLKSFVPKKTIEELGLDNINLSSEKLLVHYSKGGVKAEGTLLVTDLMVGGSKLPASTSLTKSTTFKVSVDDTQTLNIENLELSLLADNKKALSFKLSGKQNEQMRLASIKFSDLRVQPGLAKLLPAELKEKFGLENINLDSKDLSIEALNDQVSIKGSLFSNGIALSGTQFKKNFSLSQSTTLDVQLIKDQLVDIKALNIALQTNNNEALNLVAKATLNQVDKSVYAKVDQLEVSPGLRNLIPPELLTKFGLLNVNARSKGIELSFAEGKAGFVKADVAIDQLGIAGTAYEPFFITQALNVDLAINNQGLLKIGNFHSKTKPSFADEIELIAKGQVDLAFARDDSEISIDIPSVIDLDALLKLAKKQEKKKASKVSKKDEGDTEKNTSEQADPNAETRPPVKLTVKTSVNEILFDRQSIKNIRATAFINGDNYTLKEAVLQIGDAVLKAAGKMNNGAIKEIAVDVSSSGPINLSPLNDILNAGTDKKISGSVTIQKFSATSSGKNNEEMTENLNATGKLYAQDLKVKNYAKVPAFSTVLDTILGVNPENLDFHQGLIDVKIEKGILTINQMDFQGQSMAINPRGTINLNNNTYNIQMKTAAGFGGGSFLQMITGNPGLVQLINSKSKELRKFQEKFPYDASKKKFVMKDDFLFNKEIQLSNEGREKNMLQNIPGLNHVASDFLIAMFMQIGEQANLKEATAIANTLNGKGNILDGIIGIGGGLLERELNKKKNKSNVDDKKSDDPLGSILDILGGSKKKKDQKKEEKEVPKEEKKKEEPINKEDSLIKQIDNLLK